MRSSVLFFFIFSEQENVYYSILALMDKATLNLVLTIRQVFM